MESYFANVQLFAVCYAVISGWLAGIGSSQSVGQFPRLLGCWLLPWAVDLSVVNGWVCPSSLGA
jgi:hypothetical protein